MSDKQHRMIDIAKDGVVRYHEDHSYSIICPVRSTGYCTSRCSWFSYDNQDKLIRCQNSIIGQVSQVDDPLTAPKPMAGPATAPAGEPAGGPAGGTAIG